MIQLKNIGSLIRWLFKGCKTKFKDEINDNFEGVFLKSYEIENLIIGILFTIVFVCLVIIFVIL